MAVAPNLPGSLSPVRPTQPGIIGRAALRRVKPRHGCTLRKNRDDHVFQRSGTRGAKASAISAGSMGQAPKCLRISTRSRLDGYRPSAHGRPCTRFPCAGRHSRSDRQRPCRICASRARRASAKLGIAAHTGLRARRGLRRDRTGSALVAQAWPALELVARATVFLGPVRLDVSQCVVRKKSPYREDTGYRIFAAATLCSWQLLGLRLCRVVPAIFATRHG